MKTSLHTAFKLTIASVFALAMLPAGSASAAGPAVTPAEARAIAKDAYVYGFPIVDNYRVSYAYYTDKSDPNFKAPWNQIANIARVFTPADTAVQTPNSDTPYSWMGMDLRAEPIVLTVPAMEKERYFSVQLTDAYTQNFDYISSGATGNDGGVFVVAGPNWKGEKPEGVDKVFHSETELGVAVYRTQLFNPGDIDNVKKIQAGYKVETLSSFLGQPAPAALPAIDFLKPLTPDAQKTSLEFFKILNFALGYAPAVPSEVELMERFSKIGVGPGQTFDVASLSPKMKTAIENGMAEAWAEFGQFRKEKVDTGEATSGDFFGTREFLKNNYLYRMAGAALGIYGNSKQEAMYPVLAVDSKGEKLNGSNRYTLHFPAADLPPVNAFWSTTMYELPASLLVANPIDRYLLNSTMMAQFVKDADGGITLYFQNENPGKDKQANWLPAPKAPFWVIMRLYWPKESALDGSWTPPMLVRAE
ncbi:MULTISPECIES: DUF1254 domain-containing protein [unclassified Marinobacter]|uniref:DUF1254 domain-containing protein n=1 Tax=unclassified Marinobacter TaxID=83889 RepID=UPI0026E2A134|nr:MULTISPECIES: DUF1254 domain-containing protein [unclassified Marinobacter]MDO6442282.1 DUF1254 domain-containing protein [Marinobacter sp. 2_MG-2023]MDO6824948.1 DUF1254 domain-containing protein [Marinobacter sp. 1_MG-2023]